MFPLFMSHSSLLIDRSTRLVRWTANDYVMMNVTFVMLEETSLVTYSPGFSFAKQPAAYSRTAID